MIHTARRKAPMTAAIALLAVCSPCLAGPIVQSPPRLVDETRPEPIGGLPQGYEWKLSMGPDFDVYYARSDDDEAGAGIYFGNFPNPLASEDAQREPGIVAGRKVDWAVLDGTPAVRPRFYREALFEQRPGNEDEGELAVLAQVWVYAESDGDLTRLLSGLEGMRIQPTLLQQLVFVRDGSLWVRDHYTNERKLATGFDDANPAVSPDRRLAVFERRESRSAVARSSRTELWLLSLETWKAERLLLAPGACLMPSFAPDSLHVYFNHVWSKTDEDGTKTWRESIGVVNTVTGKWRDLAPLTRRVPGPGETLYAFPTASADGEWVLWSAAPQGGDTPHIHRARRDGTGESEISGHQVQASSHIYYFAVPARTSENLICFRTDNEIAAIAEIDRQGREVWHESIKGLIEDGHPPAVSSDGMTAFERIRDGSGTTEVWVLEAPSTPYRKLLDNASQPAWIW